MRADKKDVGASLGKMMFRGEKTAKQIMRRMDTPIFREALDRRGAGELGVEKIAKSLAGKDRAGLSMREMKQVVSAMQDADLAAKARSASQMVLTAARNAQENAPAFESPQERKDFMRRLAVERRKEANAEMEVTQQGEGQTGLLERMRRQKRGRASKESAEENGASSSASVSAPRERIALAPKPVLPEKPETEGENAPRFGFQA